MNKKITILKLLLLVIVFAIALTGCEKKNENKNESTNNDGGLDQSYEWSAESLDGYGVPKLEFGKITNINEVQGDGSDFNYTMEVKDIKKADLEKYINKFEGWDVFKTDSSFFLTKSETERKSSVVITYDEEDSTAEIVITVSETR